MGCCNSKSRKITDGTLSWNPVLPRPIDSTGSQAPPPPKARVQVCIAPADVRRDVGEGLLFKVQFEYYLPLMNGDDAQVQVGGASAGSQDPAPPPLMRHFRWCVYRLPHEFYELHMRLKVETSSHERSALPDVDWWGSFSIEYWHKEDAEVLKRALQKMNQPEEEEQEQSGEKKVTLFELSKQAKEKEEASTGSPRKHKLKEKLHHALAGHHSGIEERVNARMKEEEKLRKSFQSYIITILANPKLKVSPAFCEFAEVSKMSFINPDMGRVKPEGGEEEEKGESLGGKRSEGWVWKKRGGRRFMKRNCCTSMSQLCTFKWARCGYSKRWLVLRDDYLFYLRSPADERPLDMILIDSQFQVQSGRSQVGYDDALVIKNGYRSLNIRTKRAKDAVMWARALEKATEDSQYSKTYEYREKWRRGGPGPSARLSPCRLLFRFGSFAPRRSGNFTRVLVDGGEYFSELLRCLEEAEDEICMAGWWISPDLALKRPGAEHETRLVSVLKRKAEEGVKVFITCYREISSALSNNSAYTKNLLMDAHPNIQVLRHPIQFGARSVWYWSHHMKTVVIDHSVAFVGGIDVCLGRYDPFSHPISDPSSSLCSQVFPGKDYYNPCVKDVPSVVNAMESDFLDRKTQTRMPWHDVACQVVGEAVGDLARHFVQLWNHIKTDKHKGQKKYGFKAGGGRRKGKHHHKDKGGLKHLLGHDLKQTREYDSGSFGGPEEQGEIGKPGNMARAATTELGALVAGISSQATADFAADEGPTVESREGGETPPEIPSSDDDDSDEDDDQKAQWHMPHSIVMRKNGTFTKTRGWVQENAQKRNWKVKKAADRGTPDPRFKMSRLARTFSDLDEPSALEEGPLSYRSPAELTAIPGCKNCQVQVLRSCSWWSFGLPTQHSIYEAYCRGIEKAQKFVYIENQFFISSTLQKPEEGPANRLARVIAEKIIKMHKEKKNFKIYILLPVMPAFEGSHLNTGEAYVCRLTMFYQQQTVARGPNSIAKMVEDAFPNEEGASRIWEDYLFVGALRRVLPFCDGNIRGEQIYIHSKVQICDDEECIIGSANVNDRSLLGDRDSELALWIKNAKGDKDSFPFRTRMRLWSEHFGLLDSHHFDSKLESVLSQPWSDECFNTWKRIAKSNTEVVRKNFCLFPDSQVTSWKIFDEWMEKQGKYVPSTSPEGEKILRELKGRVVEQSFDFLKDEDMLLPIPASMKLAPKEMFL